MHHIQLFDGLICAYNVAQIQLSYEEYFFIEFHIQRGESSIAKRLTYQVEMYLTVDTRRKSRGRPKTGSTGSKISPWLTQVWPQ